MSCKSALYAANTAAQSVDVGGVVSFGSIVRRFGQNVYLSGGNVTIMGQGYYDLDVNLTLSDAVGTATVTIYKDGVAVPGAQQTITGVTATNYALSIPALVRETCCRESVITVVVSGADVTISNAAIVVEKV